MKKLNSSLTNMVLVLTCVAVVMGSVLALMNEVTKEPIAQQKQLALEKGIKDVMPAASGELTVAEPDTVKGTFDKKECTFIIHRVSDASGQSIGAAVESTTLGYGGNLKVLVGLQPDGTVSGYTLLEMNETPGLGAKADKWFQSDGKGSIIGKQLDPKSLLDVKPAKGGKGDVEAITASTITTRAFLKAVNQAYLTYIKTAE